MTFEEAMGFQAAFCENNGAPITGRVCRALGAALDTTSLTGARAIGWTGDYIADALPLRLVAPFHALHRSGRCPALGPLFRGEVTDDVVAIRAAIAGHDAEIMRWLDGPPQTNEPARSAGFVGALLVLAARFGLPFELLEIGSSAGLNLLIERYRYTVRDVQVGPDTSPVHIAPEWRGPPPPSAPVVIASVRGVDIAPVDVLSDAGAERLLAYVWVDQPERVERLGTAIAMLRLHPPRLDTGDAADWVEARIAEPQAAGTMRVLMHSVVWQYLQPSGRTRIMATMDAAGLLATEDRPLGWITSEVDRERGSVKLHLRAWPGGDRVLLATAHPHGSWFKWLGEERA